MTSEGEGTTSVLLLHGLTSVRRYVLMGSKAVTKRGLRTLGYDARGHGSSTGPSDPNDYTYGNLAADAAEVIRSRLDGSCLVVGVSMGAHTAIKLALDAPELVEGMLLITPAHDPDAQVEMGPWLALADGLERGGVEGFVEATDFERVEERWRTISRQATLQRMALHERPYCVAAALRGVPHSRPFQGWEDLSAIDVPTFVVGSRDGPDPGHPLVIAERVAESISGAVLLVEDPEDSPLAWRGASISAAVLDLAKRI